MHNDSVDKIVTRYFATVAAEPFHYNGRQFTPKPLAVSPLLLRGYTCPEKCGACCLKFTLDYIPGERRPKDATIRTVEFNDEDVVVYTDPQRDNDTKSCRHLDQESGRCGIHGYHPFTCDFELIRTLEFAEPESPNVLTQKLYGRGWNMLRVDGERGARCEMTDPDPATVADVLRKLDRLKAWTDHFGLTRTWIPKIQTLIRMGRLTEKVVLSVTTKPKPDGAFF
jgi:hypothetical protein